MDRITIECNCGTRLRVRADARAVRCPACRDVTRVKEQESFVILPEKPLPVIRRRPAPRRPEYDWGGILPLILASLAMAGGLANAGLCLALMSKTGGMMIGGLVMSVLLALSAARYVFTGSAGARKLLVGLLAFGLLGIAGLFALVGADPFVIGMLVVQVGAILILILPSAGGYSPGHTMPVGVTWGLGGAAAALGVLAALGILAI